MNPTNFDQANTLFGPPPDLDESQCRSIPAFQGTVNGGSVDGASLTVVCWQPTPVELARLAEGRPIFLTFIGGLPPHYPSMSFEEAVNPS